MKNIYYAIISTLLVTVLLFAMYYGLDMFQGNVTEGNINRAKKQVRAVSPNKSRQQSKADAKTIRQVDKRKEKEVCIGNNCKQWSKNTDMTTDAAPETKMDDMRYAMHYDAA